MNHITRLCSMTGTDSEPDDLAFLSPDESPTERKKGPEATKDGGASPTLRRSSRKRKSISVANGMSKNSASKKKKNSPDPGRSMPRIPRTPQGGRQEDGTEPVQPSELETLLAAMEGRLAAKIELSLIHI